jgi:hypothetical protein
MNHIEFEKRLMKMLLDGDDPVLEGLRYQYINTKVESREFTGSGFYTNFKIQDGIEPLLEGKNFQIGDLHASFNEIKEAFGFILFIKKGFLLMLEGYTLACDIWPVEYSNVILAYNGLEGKRDLVKLKAKWV